MTTIGNEIMIGDPNYLIQAQPLPTGSVLGGSGFQKAMNDVGNVAGGLGQIAGVLDPTGLLATSSLENLINEQMAIQIAMQQVTFESNVSKSDHEMRMAPIRNLRTS